ncbi:MAG: hypothetical protein NT028_07675 [candidate division Zixibacteria bacterium]|nr:hypothetical protein [candidate division Zixibacteria bacterium]
MERFESILVLLDYLKSETPANPLGTINDCESWEWIDWGDADGGRIMPSLNSPFISPFF